MGRKRNKYYLSGKTKRLYRKNAARMRQVRNSNNINNTIESKNEVQSTANTETANNVTVMLLSKSKRQVRNSEKSDNNVDTNTDVQGNASTDNITFNSVSENMGQARNSENSDITKELTTDIQGSPSIDIEDNIALNLVSENMGKTCEEKQVCRRIIHVSHFFKELQEISSHGPLSCGLTSMKIISEVRVGLISKLKLKCMMCNMSFILDCDTRNPEDEMDINTSAVAGAIATGCGYLQLKELTSAIGLAPMSDKLFSTKMDLVNKKWEEELFKSMSDAGKEEYDLAIKEGKVHSDGTPIIDVIADGCYGKRSYKKNYSSLSGAAAIIGKRTNKILFLGIKNKYCHICSVSQSKGVETKEHVCYKNYTGPSTGMESDILVEGFKRSLEMHNLIYGRLISDGDANTYSKILQARPYGNFTVEKVECRNHLLRNFCNKLVAVTTETKYPIKFRKYLTKKRILSMRKVVVEAVKTHKQTGNVSSVHQDIMNAAEHAFGRHNKCKNYYCTKNEDDKNIDESLFSNSIWLRIKLIINQLAAHSRSLVIDVDSNSVERYHSIVAKFVGGKRINFSQKYQYKLRCNAAAISFNTHKPLSVLHKSIVGRSPRNNIKRFEEWKIKKLKSAKKNIKKKIRFEKQDSRNYGEDCSKPDIDEDMMLKSKEAFLQNLQKSPEERERIARETVLQSGCSEWLELRRNILTASNFGRVVKRRLNISCQNIVKDILYKKSIEHVQSIKHGKDNEKLALEQLSAQENVKILPCGLYIDPGIPYFGASPDGITEEGILVEMKCPKTSFNIGLETAIDNKKIQFYKKDRDGILQINKEHYWYYQVQGQLHITRREKCLFAIWSGENLPIKTEIIERDDHLWSSKMEKKLKDFYLDCLLPELIDPRFSRKMPIRDPKYIMDAIEIKNEKQEKNRKAEQTVSKAKKKKL